jgi:predicted permease
MTALLQDLKYAGRMLRKSPGLTAAVALSLAIGIGANSAVFSVVDALLLRPLPYPQPGRLAAIWIHSPGIGIFRDWPSPGQFDDIRKQNRSFDDISISRLQDWTLGGLDQPYRVSGMRTSSNLLRMLGAKPLVGRVLLADDDVGGKTPVAVLSYDLWQRRFSADRGIVGRTILLNTNPVQVVGVLRKEFRLNTEVMPAEGPMDNMELYVSFPMGADILARRGDENYNLTARLKPGVTVAQAQQDVDAVANRIREKDKRDRTFGMTVIGLQEQVAGDVTRALLVLMGAVTLVLLSACANVANILLARAAGREKEIAIRAAMGAGWRRMARQLLAESLLLAAIGGAAGLLLAEAGLAALHALNPGNIPRLEDIGIDGGVLAFTFAAALATGVLFGLAPVWRALKVDLNTSLKSGGRSGQSDGGMRIAKNRLRGLLVVSELALSLMLLIGAGLLVRSFVQLESVSPGFAADHVIAMRVAAQGVKYRQDQPVIEFFKAVNDRITHLPGVTGVGEVSVLPLTGDVSWGGIQVEGYHPAPGQELQVDQRTASADYFRTMEIPLRQGRYFDEHDTTASPKAAIVDEHFAKRFWPKGDAIGKRVWFDKPENAFAIVGVVGSVRHYGLAEEGKIVVYFAHGQQAQNQMQCVVRTAGDPAALGQAIVHEVHAVDPSVAVYQVRTMEDRLYASLARQRFATTMLGAFALFALILAAVGVYGVMSYMVSQGTHDIGVRVALGAARGNIVGMVLRQGMELAAAGIALGLIGAFALTRVMSSLLFGVSATDALTFVATGAVLAAVAALAVYAPALRATKVDPMVALREE